MAVGASDFALSDFSQKAQSGFSHGRNTLPRLPLSENVIKLEDINVLLATVNTTHRKSLGNDGLPLSVLKSLLQTDVLGILFPELSHVS